MCATAYARMICCKLVKHIYQNDIASYIYMLQLAMAVSLQ